MILLLTFLLLILLAGLLASVGCMIFFNNSSCYKSVYINSFSPRTAEHLNTLSVEWSKGTKNNSHPLFLRYLLLYLLYASLLCLHLFPVTPWLAVAIQSFLEWILIKKYFCGTWKCRKIPNKVEAVVRRCSIKKFFLEILQNSQENTCARDTFLIKLQA